MRTGREARAARPPRAATRKPGRAPAQACILDPDLSNVRIPTRRAPRCAQLARGSGIRPHHGPPEALWCLVLMMIAALPALLAALTSGSCDDGLITVAPGESISLARDAARSCRSSAASDGVGRSVELRLLPGRHALLAPLLLDERDSGTRWTGGGQASISGGVFVGPWHAADAGGGPKGLLQAALPAPMRRRCPRQLWVGGRRASRTAVDLPASSIFTAAGIVAPSNWSDPRRWADPSGAVEVVHDSAFQQSRCAVRNVTALANGSTLLTMAQPCWALGRSVGAMGPSFVHDGHTYPLRALGGGVGLSPGQFACSAVTKRLTYLPASETERLALLHMDVSSQQPAPLEVVAPVTEALIIIDGAVDVHMTGLSFLHSGWQAPSEADGYLERYGGVRMVGCDSAAAEGKVCFRSPGDACAAGCCGMATLGGCALTMAPAAVQVRRSRSLRVESCTFSSLGAWGLALMEGVTDSSVSHNLFTQLSGGGLYIGNINLTRFSLPETLRPARLSIADNVIANVGEEYQGSCGISLFAAVDSTIEHNQLYNISYTAITFNWPAPQNESWSSNLTLRANDVSHYSTWGTDGGAVHTLAWCRGCVLEKNHFHDQGCCGSKVTYIDNGSSGFLVKDHVVDATGGALWLFYQQGCASHCPYYATAQIGWKPNPYPGCNSSTNHAKCCCNCGTDNVACPAEAPCWVRMSAPDPFPI
eukprot:COSAG06_NODE_3669_length_5040_cov_3.451123_6_plen_704_part_01